MENKKDFNPKEHLIQIKSGNTTNDYLPVAWRMVWFREKFPHGSIETEIVVIDMDKEVTIEKPVWNNNTRRMEKIKVSDKGYAIFQATVKDGMGGVAKSTKMENKASFEDFIEKAETGSIGRALAALGYGTQFTGDEFNEAHRIVDAPQDMHNEGTRIVEGNGEVAKGNFNGMEYDRKAYGNWVNGIIKNSANKNIDTTLICKELEITSIDKESLTKINKYLEGK